MGKNITVPILNHEYKVVVCWDNKTHLKKTLEAHHYNPDNVTKTMIEQQIADRRGVTFREYRCYPTIWLNGEVEANEIMGTLAHEAVHAVDFIFEAIDENMYHSEVFAHSVGAIVRETIKAMGILKPTQPSNTEGDK